MQKEYPVPNFAVWKSATDLPKDSRKILVLSLRSGETGEWNADHFAMWVRSNLQDLNDYYFVDLRNLIPYQLKHPKRVEGAAHV